LPNSSIKQKEGTPRDCAPYDSPERHEEPVCHKLDVLAHEVGIHAHQRAAQRLCAELKLQIHSIRDNCVHLLMHERVRMGVTRSDTANTLETQ